MQYWKRRFMQEYVDNILKLGFLKHTEGPKWVSLSKIVPEKPPAMFHIAIDNRQINAATIPIFWPMPDINNERSSVNGATCFCGIDFCSGYWQLPMVDESQPLFEFMIPQGVVQPAWRTQGAINSASKFHRKWNPSLQSYVIILKPGLTTLWVTPLQMLNCSPS